MDLKTTYKLYEQLKSDRFSFLYQGEFSDEVMLNVLELNDTNIENIKELLSFKKKISLLMVECIQNISTHSVEPEIVNQTNNRPKMFMVRNCGDDYYISSVNLIKNEKLDTLQNKLRELSSLSKEELYKNYVEILTGNENKDGLGLIEMVQTADKELEFKFEFVNFYLSLFYVLIKAKNELASEDLEDTDNPAPKIDVDNAQDLHNSMIKDDLTMVYKGDFSEDSILPIIKLMEQNLVNGKAKGSKKKILYLLIEMLQNISRHALTQDNRKDGIFLIGKTKEGYMINTGNLVNSSSKESLEKLINGINELDDASLDENYKASLSEPLKASTNGSGAGLGMLDIARYSENKIQYLFEETEGENSFFSMSISI